MHIQEIASCTPNLSDELLGVWERSIRATHHFLAESDIVRIRAYVSKAIQTVEHLAAAEDSDGKALALIGAQEGRLEMLFVGSSCRGRGIGSTPLDYALSHWDVSKLTVNEQNPQAIAFYEHEGFAAYMRTDADEEGEPFPLICMRLADC
jgi:putative acetyltransferase